jgi:hypothetical protein
MTELNGKTVFTMTGWIGAGSGLRICAIFGKNREGERILRITTNG